VSNKKEESQWDLSRCNRCKKELEYDNKHTYQVGNSKMGYKPLSEFVKNPTGPLYCDFCWDEYINPPHKRYR